MHSSIAGVVVLSLVLGAPSRAASAAVPRLVAELDDSVYDADDLPTSLLPVGGQVVFLNYSSAAESIILWASDGTTQGTRPLAELSHQYEGARGWGTLNNLALFAATEDYLSRVWRTDGTIAGTYPLTRQLPIYDRGSVIARTRAYFMACDSPRCEVWSTDGTLEGTRQVGAAELSFPRKMVALGDDAYFLADSADGKHTELWRASAQEGRVERLRTLSPFPYPDPSDLVAAGGRLFFLPPDGGRQIWTSDGTAAGTVPVTHFPPQNGWATRLLGGYFDRAWFAANDGKGVQLWSSDGTQAGTRRATDLVDRTLGSQLAQVGDRLLFTVWRHGRLRLWTTTGDWRTSQPLTGCPGGCPTMLALPITTAGGRAFFWASRTYYSAELWITDGTGPATTRIRRFEYDPVAGISGLSMAGGLFFFSLAKDFGSDRFLWSSDGTLAGTVKLANNDTFLFRDELLLPAAVGGRVFFPAFDKAFTGSLWVTRGRGPAAEVFSLPRLAASSRPKPMATAADRLLFFTCTNAGCPALWSTGSTDLEPLLADSALADSCESDPVQWTVPAGQRVLFNASWNCTLTQGDLLLGTDGTPKGSEEIPFPDGLCVQRPASLKDRVFFGVADRCRHSTGDLAALWSSDGTAAGTRSLVQLPPGVPGQLVSDGTRLCFPFREDAEAPEAQVWCSDGTAAGTKPLGPHLQDISFLALLDHRLYFLNTDTTVLPATLGSLDAAGMTNEFSLSDLGVREPLGFTTAVGRLWFAARLASDAVERWWLWTSDGTLEGTRRLPAEVRRESLSTDEELQLTALASRVYFAGEDDRHGRELWSSDGTVAGTAPILDLAPGPADGAPLSNVVVWHGRLYFAANDMQHGAELWSSDGTAAGTRLEFDLFPGPRWSWPGDLRVAGDRLYFAAQDESHGRELWVIEESAPSP